jgi:ricin-type beta-trefoil lectin protein
VGVVAAPDLDLAGLLISRRCGQADVGGWPSLSLGCSDPDPPGALLPAVFSAVAALRDMPVTMNMNMKRKIVVAAAASAAAVAATALAVPAHAAAPKPYRNGLNPGLCLDADAHNGGVGPGANVTAWPCHGGLNQKWFINTVGEIRNFSNDRLCLDAAAPNGGVSPGAHVTAWPCHGGPNQKWG